MLLVANHKHCDVGSKLQQIVCNLLNCFHYKFLTNQQATVLNLHTQPINELLLYCLHQQEHVYSALEYMYRH